MTPFSTSSRLSAVKQKSRRQGTIRWSGLTIYLTLGSGGAYYAQHSSRVSRGIFLEGALEEIPTEKRKPFLKSQSILTEGESLGKSPHVELEYH